MHLHISTKPLTDEEWEEIENILLDELELQAWYGVAIVPEIGGEILVPVQ